MILIHQQVNFASFCDRFHGILTIKMGSTPSSLTGKSIEELAKKAKESPRQMNDAEWQDLLGKQRFYVTREKGTERPFTSCLNKEKREGNLLSKSYKNVYGW